MLTSIYYYINKDKKDKYNVYEYNIYHYILYLQNSVIW